MDDWKWYSEKNLLSLQKRDALNRSSWKYLFPKTTVCPERTLRLKVLRKSSSLEKKPVPKATLASAIVYNCSLKIFPIIYE